MNRPARLTLAAGQHHGWSWEAHPSPFDPGCVLVSAVRLGAGLCAEMRDFRPAARIGQELKLAQERGEVGVNGGDRRSIIVQTSDAAPVAFQAIGIARQRAAEFKAMADAGEQATREEPFAARYAQARAGEGGSGVAANVAVVLVAGEEQAHCPADATGELGP